MLGVCDQDQLELPEWTTLKQRARLPVSLPDFLAKAGPLPMLPDTRRGFRRMYLRIQAVLSYHEQLYAVYVSDVSRTGAGFFSPVQLLPSTPIKIWLPDGRQLDLVSKYCVRLEPCCYRCGAKFAISR